MFRRTVAGSAFVLASTAFTALTFKEWSATLRPLDGSTVTGTATVSPRDGDTLLVNIRVKGGKAGESLPWHVHSGGCDSSGAVVGDSKRYMPMTIGADQSGESTARVKAMLTIGVPYSVNVHRSPSDMAVIACGNLRPVAGP
jgi:hypothetical protein